MIMAQQEIIKNYQEDKTSIACHKSTRRVLGGLCFYGIPLECIILRMVDVISSNPELKKLVTEYNGYEKMRREIVK